METLMKTFYVRKMELHVYDKKPNRNSFLNWKIKIIHDGLIQDSFLRGKLIKVMNVWHMYLEFSAYFIQKKNK